MNSSFAVWRQLWLRMRPLFKVIALAILLGSGTVGCGIGLLACSAYLISEAALHPPLADLAVAILCVRVSGIVRGIWRYLERLVSHHVTFRFLANLRLWFYRSLEQLAPAHLRARTPACQVEYTTGDLLSRFIADIETLQDLSARALVPAVVAFVVGLTMTFVLGAYHLQFALAFFILYLLTGIGIPLFVYAISRKLEQRIVSVRAVLSALLVDSIQGMADLLAFDQAEAQCARVHQYHHQLIRLYVRRAWVEGLREMLTHLLTDGCVWIMLFLAIPLVRTGRLSGVFLACIALAALASFEAVEPLAHVAQRLGGCLEAARRLIAVAQARPAVQEPAHAAPTPAHFVLEVQNLSFRYTQEEPAVLKHISFAVPQGHCVAIVGPSGAGKSTLASLLLRFWEYQQGSIMFGGCTLRSMRQEDVLHCMGVVEQQTHLFNMTVRENLLLARPEASQEDIERAARQALIHDFIQALPQGYDTLIGEQGFKLSGGERQRLALARTILKDAPILLLDEPTAHLDMLTEQAVISSLHAFMQGRTTVLITHRLVGLESADEILVMEQGEIVERGKHDDLLQARGLYWKYWTLQQQFLNSSSSPGPLRSTMHRPGLIAASHSLDRQDYAGLAGE